MATLTKTFPKNPDNPDETMALVLDDIKFRNHNSRKLVGFEIGSKEVTLVYESDSLWSGLIENIRNRWS